MNYSYSLIKSIIQLNSSLADLPSLLEKFNSEKAKEIIARNEGHMLIGYDLQEFSDLRNFSKLS